MAKTKSPIKKIELNFLTFLKELTLFLNEDNYDIKVILNLIEKHDVSPQFLFKRIIAYSYNHPYIIWYINKYMNGKYEFFKYDIESFLISFKYLIKTNNHNRLFFFKAKDFKDENKLKIKKLLKEYYSTIYKKQLNDLELNHLYLMFVKKVTPIEEIYEINRLLNGEKSKFVISENTLIGTVDNKPEQDKTKINEYINYHISKMLPDNIFEFIIELQNKKKETCEKCSLFNKSMVLFDTNVSTFQPVDFMFVLLNPGPDEVTYKKLCVGESGKILRESMYNLNSKISWVITNLIQCSTNTQKDIGKTEKAIKTVVNNCKPFLNEIIQKFPAKYYILIGKHSMESFGIKGSITQNSGSIQTIDSNILIPMIHPSTLSRNINNKPIYDKAWQVVYQLANKLINSQINSTEQMDTLIETGNVPKTDLQLINETKLNVSKNKYNIDDSKIIDSEDIPLNLTYFDTVDLDGNEMLNVFVDDNSEKFYQLVKFEVPIYIKNSESYNECNMLNQDFESITHVNGWNKYKLSKALKDNLIKHQYASLSQKVDHEG